MTLCARVTSSKGLRMTTLPLPAVASCRLRPPLERGCLSLQQPRRPGSGRKSPNRKLNIGVVGPGGRGYSNLEGVARENVVAICDVDDRRAKQSRDLSPKGGAVPRLPPDAGEGKTRRDRRQHGGPHARSRQHHQDAARTALLPRKAADTARSGKPGSLRERPRNTTSPRR